MKTNMLETVKTTVVNHPARSAWEKGVKKYALELLENLPDLGGFDGLPDPIHVGARADLYERMLGGARNWRQYSYGGCALVYDQDIAERLCCPSELRRCRNGERLPNSLEIWLDVQARALHQAAGLIFAVWAEAALQ